MRIIKTESFNPSKRGARISFSSNKERQSKFEQEKKRVYTTVGILTVASIALWSLTAFLKNLFKK